MPHAPDTSYGVAPPGYRLPAGTRVGTVRLQVADLDRSVAYYENVIGFRVVDRDGARAALAPSGAAGGGPVLIELHARPGAHPVPRRGRIGLYHFAILLPTRGDLARFVRHLASRGVHAGMADHTVSEAVYLFDPDGLGIEVYADRPRDSWRTVDHQFVMTTDPLDVDDLLAAAGTAAWTGAPAGTTIGHVHLFVRDLDVGARFYHEALGLDRTVWGYPGALFLSAGGYHHHLGTNTWAAGAPAASDDDARLLEWELVLPGAGDVDAAADSLAAHGVAVERADAGADAGPEAGADRSAAAADPWGTRLRLVTEHT